MALLEPSGDILWESVRALENATGEIGDIAFSAWNDWLEPMRQLDAVKEGFFDPTHAEILAARETLGSAVECDACGGEDG